MPDLVEIILQILLECVFEGLDLPGYWRLLAPSACSIIGAAIAYSFMPQGIMRVILSVAVVAIGIVSGLFWQGSSG